MVGDMYCSSPSTAIGILRAPAANSSSGMAVIGPAAQQQRAGAGGFRLDEAVLAVHGQPHHVDQRQREQDHGFQRQAFERGQRRRLAQQAVAAEGDASIRAIHGTCPACQVSHSTPQAASADRHPLHAPQAFLQHQQAQHDIDQRIDEVAEAGVDDVAIVDRPDIDEPVGRQQQRAGDEAGQHAGLRFSAAQPVPLAAHGQHDGQEQQRPQHAVRQDFQRRHLADGVEVQREQAPAQEREGGVQDAWIHDGRSQEE